MKHRIEISDRSDKILIKSKSFADMFQMQLERFAEPKPNEADIFFSSKIGSRYSGNKRIDCVYDIVHKNGRSI